MPIKAGKVHTDSPGDRRCNQQLVINGAFAANTVMLDRSYSSLRYSIPGENKYTSQSHSCGNDNLDTPAGQVTANDCAAEIFNFGPEAYLSQPAMAPRRGVTTGIYDSITSLPPVL